jgi:hypothetical protein
MCFSLYVEVTIVLCEPFVTGRISIWLSDFVLTWCWHHEKMLQWCQGCWCGADITKKCFSNVKGADVVLTSQKNVWKQMLHFTLLRKLCVQYTNCFYYVESVYFFYSNPVKMRYSGKKGTSSPLTTWRSVTKPPLTLSSPQTPSVCASCIALR